MNRGFALAAGFAVLAVLWEGGGRLAGPDGVLPPLSAIAAASFAPEQRALLVDAVVTTGGEALLGLVLGALTAIAVAIGARLVPPLRNGLVALAGIVNGIPIIAVAGVCVLTLPRDATPVVVAAFAAAFIVFVGATSGFAAPAPEMRALFTALGASPLATFLHLEAPAAVPSIVTSVRSAAPVSVVGAILGEWFSSEHGLGPMLIAALQSYQTVALWSVATAGSLLSIAFYVLLGFALTAAERRVA